MSETKKKPANVCFACNRRKCYFRAVADDRAFDEVACRDHMRELEIEVSRVGNGRKFRFAWSTGPLRRGRS